MNKCIQYSPIPHFIPFIGITTHFINVANEKPKIYICLQIEILETKSTLDQWEIEKKKGLDALYLSSNAQVM